MLVSNYEFKQNFQKMTIYFKMVITLKKPPIDVGFKLYSKITCDIWVNHIH